MKQIIYTLAVLFTSLSFAQEDTVIQKQVDSKAYYYEGNYRLNRTFEENTNLFNKDVPESSDGIVVVKCVIQSNGKIGKMTVAKSLNAKFDQEALRLVSMLGRWRPARINYETCNSYKAVKIDFKKFVKEESNAQFHETPMPPPPVKLQRKSTNKPTIFHVSEVSPEFPGGYKKMAKYIQKTVKYPQISVDLGDEGKVYVKFVVKSDGYIGKVRVIKGITDELDAEALRVVKGMPRWEPGKQKGKAVNCWFTIPISFKIGIDVKDNKKKKGRK